MSSPAYTDITSRIAAAAGTARRDPSDITLVAVSKQQPWAHIAPILEAGHRVFGENRVQDAGARWQTMRDTMPDLRLHLIGPLQSNKAREAVALFDVIETVDRPKLGHALRHAIDELGRTPCLYVQVNTGDEPQKAGVPPQDLAALLDTLRQDCRLQISGLMCIPPVHDDPRLHFALLRQLAARHGLPELSMGMSADFEAAVRMGATSVRVGSALFGARQ